MVEITVNGRSLELGGNSSIVALLDELGLPADRVAVELNKVLVRKRDWPATAIPEGAHLEIVEFVGGG